jgi:hypothetical protein
MTEGSVGVWADEWAEMDAITNWSVMIAIGDRPSSFCTLLFCNVNANRFEIVFSRTKLFSVQKDMCSVSCKGLTSKSSSLFQPAPSLSLSLSA